LNKVLKTYLSAVQTYIFYQVGYECISLSFHPFGSALAAGSSEGHLIVVNAETGSTMLTLRVCGSPLNCLEYNQIGDMVAIGSQNGKFFSLTEEECYKYSNNSCNSFLDRINLFV
jgi:WD40 repeat protein